MKLSVRLELVARRGATRMRSARRPPSAKSPIACHRYRLQACCCGQSLPIGGGGGVSFVFRLRRRVCLAPRRPKAVRRPRWCSKGERPSTAASGRIALQHGLGSQGRQRRCQRQGPSEIPRKPHVHALGRGVIFPGLPPCRPNLRLLVRALPACSARSSAPRPDPASASLGPARTRRWLRRNFARDKTQGRTHNV